ncbi:hypothetical protein CR513_51413, partial [Mucuna pruriens]
MSKRQMFRPYDLPYDASFILASNYVSKTITTYQAKTTQNNNPRNRRDILIGLGGLYDATSLDSNSCPLPDPTNCVPVNVPDPDLNCCPPFFAIGYKLPPLKFARIRQPAHLVSDEYIAKV